MAQKGFFENGFHGICQVFSALRRFEFIQVQIENGFQAVRCVFIFEDAPLGLTLKNSNADAQEGNCDGCAQDQKV